MRQVPSLCFYIKFSDTASIKLVSIVAAESDKEEEYAPRAAAKKAAVKIPPPVRVKAVKHKEESMPVKAQMSKKGSVVKTAVAVKAKPKRLNGNNVRIYDLPGFAETEWRGSFLPTLYDKFFSSDKPFDAFYHGSNQFVALLQVIIEEVYPNIEYTVTSSDAIYLLVSHFFSLSSQFSKFPLLSRHIIVSTRNDPVSVPMPSTL